MKGQVKYQVIGLMSGTSLDGLDMAYCEFSLEDGQWQLIIPVAETQPYNEVWQQKLGEITEVSGEELIFTDRDLGVWMGEAVKEFINKYQLKPDFIASHGHTVFHQPEKGITYQMGNSFAIQAISDIGTANMVMNYFAQQLGQSFDVGGQIAQQGEPNQSLLASLNQLPYYRQPFPKSLGYEWVHQEIIQPLEQENLSIADAITTALHHAAYQVAKDVNTFADEKTGTFRVLVPGGGAFNVYFMDTIRKNCSETVELVVPDKKTVAFKEALVFAFLGVLRVRNEINCLQSVTGAQYDHSAGVIFGNLDHAQ